MASFATTIFFTCMHAHKTLSNEMLLLRKIAELEIETAHIMVFKVPIMLCSNSQCQINFFIFLFFYFIFYFYLFYFFYAKLTIKKRYSQSHSQGLVQGDVENKTKSYYL